MGGAAAPAAPPCGAMLRAQNCILLYRGFPIRKVRDTLEGSELAALCRMQFGDTAD
jgi:hypothetical protein